MATFSCRLASINGSLGIERIKDGFNKQGVNPTLKKSISLLKIGIIELVVADVASSRVVDIGTHGGSLVGWSYGTAYETGPLIG